ncbi:MAG: phosphoglycerate dehydrogenase [Nitrospinales bacterium]
MSGPHSREGRGPKVAATPPAFCGSKILRAELARAFPDTAYNETGRYLTESELIEFLSDADAALVGRDPVGERVLRALPRLKVVAKYGVGLDNIDRQALQRRRVALCWTSGVNKRSVAELTLCFILGLCRRVFVGARELKRGQWVKDGGTSFAGKTLGIIGCGHVGKEVARLARPFDCRILVRDILDMPEFCRQVGAVQVEFADLIESSDIVSLHVPLTQATRGMIDGSVLRRMKPAAYLVNTSRGAVVDQQALKTALRERVIAGAALDVFESEPPDDLEFLACPNLMVTPHIGGNSVEAVEAMGRAAIDQLVKFFNC